MKHQDEVPLRTIIIAILITAFIIAVILLPMPQTASAPAVVLKEVPHIVERAQADTLRTIRAHVTGYNTVPEQTDSTPCIAASGDNICGRTDVVACPRAYPLGTEVMIDGKLYRCLDRTATKFDGRWDISCDKDMKCPYLVAGIKDVLILE